MQRALLSNPKFRLFKKVKVGVVRGGTSAERKISLCSGRAVHKALKRTGVSVVVIDPANRRTFFKKIHHTDVLFLALHGKGGEDGVLQKELENRRIQFTGSGSQACRNSFCKAMTKKHLKRLGVPTPHFSVLDSKNWRKIAAKFPAPYFIKPLDGGSSQGIFLVEDFQKFAEKLRQSILRNRKLLIEQKISGRELTVGILGRQRLPIVEVKPKRSFYDYKAKYTKGMTVYEVPARIPRKLAKRIQALAWRVYRGVGLAGFARVDFMIDKKNRPFVLEVNSIPGLTEFSLVPKAARAVGISFEELCLSVLREALARKMKR